MTKKQKKVLYRIIIASILLIVLHFLPVSGMLAFGLYLIPYFVIGYDILRKAVLGIIRGQVFDENFLMAVATVGAMALAVYEELTGGEGEFAEGGTEAVAVGGILAEIPPLRQGAHQIVDGRRVEPEFLADIRQPGAGTPVGDAFENIQCPHDRLDEFFASHLARSARIASISSDFLIYIPAGEKTSRRRCRIERGYICNFGHRNVN